MVKYLETGKKIENIIKILNSYNININENYEITCDILEDKNKALEYFEIKLIERILEDYLDLEEYLEE